MSLFEIKNHQDITRREQALTGGPENPIEAREKAQPVSGPVMQWVRANGGVINEAGDLDLSNVVLTQVNRDEHGEVTNELTYLLNQRVVADEETKYKEGTERTWSIPKAGSAHLLEEFGRKEKVPKKDVKKQSVVDLDVLDSEGRIICKASFDSQTEFLAFLDSHDDLPARQKREKWAQKHGFGIPHYLIQQSGRITRGKTVVRNSSLPRGSITGIGWGPKRPEVAAELDETDRRRFEIPEGEKDEDKFERVSRRREEIGIPGKSLVGLTLKKDGRILQVNWEGLVHTPEAKGKEITRLEDLDNGDATRTWQITEYEEYEEGGITHRRSVKQKSSIYSDNELRFLLNGDDVSDIHFEYPEDVIHATRAARKLGRMAAVAIRVDTPPADWSPKKKLEFATRPGLEFRRIALEDAFEFLASPDVCSEKEVEAKVKELKSNRGEVRIAKRLQKIITEYGTTRVSQLAEQLKDEYIESANLLGLDVSREKASISWALREIAEQWFTHRRSTIAPDKIEKGRRTDEFGIKAGNPLSHKSSEARRKRVEIVDYQTGLAFLSEILKASVGGKQVKVISKEGLIELKNKPQLMIRPDSKRLKKLHELVEPEVKSMTTEISDLLTEVMKDTYPFKTGEVPEKLSLNMETLRQLSRADVTRLGRLLRR